VNLSAPASANLTGPVIPPGPLTASSTATSPLADLFQALFGSMAGLGSGAEEEAFQQQSTACKDLPAKKDAVSSELIDKSPLPSAALSSNATTVAATVLLAPAPVRVTTESVPEVSAPAHQTAAEQEQVPAADIPVAAYVPVSRQVLAPKTTSLSMPAPASSARASLPSTPAPPEPRSSAPQLSVPQASGQQQSPHILNAKKSSSVPAPRQAEQSSIAPRFASPTPPPSRGTLTRQDNNAAPRTVKIAKPAAPPSPVAPVRELPAARVPPARQDVLPTATEPESPSTAVHPEHPPVANVAPMPAGSSKVPQSQLHDSVPVRSAVLRTIASGTTPAKDRPPAPSVTTQSSVPTVPQQAPAPASSAHSVEQPRKEPETNTPASSATPQNTSQAAAVPAPAIPAAIPEVPSAPMPSAPAPERQAPGASDQPSAPPAGSHTVSPTPQTSFVQQAENLAFSLRMVPQEPVPQEPLPAPAAQAKTVTAEQRTSPNPARYQTETNFRHEPQPPAEPISRSDNRGPEAELLRRYPAAETGLRWNELGALQHSEAHTAASADIPEPAHAEPESPIQELHPLLQEPAKAPVSSEILLHVSGGDPSAAASIRVADRAGAVNVSVHASDPDLRNSLRSNLGELSTQLNTQGWKTEVNRPVPAATHAETFHDSRSEGQRSFNQQRQSAGGDRQQGQQRRANTGRWQDEFEEQIASQPTSAGGKN